MFCKHLKALTLVLITGFFSATVSAGIIPWTANIDGAQEVPLSGSTGTGSAFGTVDDISGLLTWNISWAGLTSPVVGLHFHGPAPVGVNAGVFVNVGAISGLSSPNIGSATITPLQIDYFRDGLVYINIHTEAFTAGEIRGQVAVTSVPTPGTLVLLGLGLGALGWKVRKKA